MTQKETKSEDTTKFDKALLDQIEKETQDEWCCHEEVAEYNRWFLNTVRNRHDKQAAEREYIANWKKNKERTELIQMRNDS